MLSNFRSLLLLAVLLALLSCTRHKRSESPPNVIVILADDLGFETIGAYGGESYQTPEIDRIAARGMRFEYCYAQPLCTPSRVQMMTGIYNVRNYIRFGLLDPGQTTFGHLFKEAGYTTCIIGKWQLGKDPESPQMAGFDHSCLWQVQEGRVDSSGRDTRYSGPVLEQDGILTKYGKADYGPEIVCDYGLDFIEKNHEEGTPFLLYYPMILTHCPFSPTPGSPEWHEDDTTVYSYKGEPEYFKDMVEEMDALVGKITGKLQVLGIQKNTLVIFTGDNGTDEPIVSRVNGREIAGGKGQSTDAGTRVPLIVQWPGTIGAGTVNKDLVDFTDFLPTICEAAKITVPDSLDLDGHSFLPQLLGRETDPREWIYSWFSRNGEVSNAVIFARNQQYKLYESGEFYDIPNDWLEQTPLKVNELDPDAMAVYHKLSGVLDYYKKKRLDKIPGSLP